MLDFNTMKPEAFLQEVITNHTHSKCMIFRFGCISEGCPLQVQVLQSVSLLMGFSLIFGVLCFTLQQVRSLERLQHTETLEPACAPSPRPSPGHRTPPAEVALGSAQLLNLSFALRAVPRPLASGHVLRCSFTPAVCRKESVTSWRPTVLIIS